VAVEKLHSKILIAMVLAVRMANLEKQTVSFCERYRTNAALAEGTSLFSWTCEAPTPAFCVHKTQRNSHRAMRILLELS
jgi:hypothetical protein